MGIKISELQSFVGSVQDTDLLEISVDNGVGGFNSRKITGAQFKSLINSFTIYESDGTITGNRALDGDSYTYAISFNNVSGFTTDAKIADFILAPPSSLTQSKAFNIEVDPTYLSGAQPRLFQVKDSVANVVRFGVIDDGSLLINSAYKLPNADGGPGQVLTTDGSGSVAFGNVSTGFFSQTADGATVTNTTTPTNIIGSGVGTLTVPANGFSVGDSFHCVIKGNISNLNNETILIELKSGSVVLATSGTLTIPAMTNQTFEIEADFVIRAIGGAGVASIFTGAEFNYIQNSGTSFQGKMFHSLNNTTFDTTASNTLEVCVTWGTASASNIIYSHITNLRRTY